MDIFADTADIEEIKKLNDLGIIEHGYLVVRDGLIERVESGNPKDEFIASNENIPVVDAYGRVLMPAFVDCHTHCCWAGSRLDEFEMGLRGTSYLDILAQGGGIMSTVRSVREAPQEDLAEDSGNPKTGGLCQVCNILLAAAWALLPDWSPE